MRLSSYEYYEALSADMLWVSIDTLEKREESVRASVVVLRMSDEFGAAEWRS